MGWGKRGVRAGGALGLGLLLSCGGGERRPFEGLEVAFMVGGGRDHPFARRVYRGARDAEEQLGCRVTYYWSDWDRDRMVKNILRALKSEPDAICLMGHPGEALIRPLVEQAQRQGIQVTSQNVYLPSLERRFQHKGFGYVGQEVFQAGRKLTATALRRFPPPEGARIGVVGVGRLGGRGERTLGVLEELDSRGLEYSYRDVTEYVPREKAFNRVFREYLADEGRLDYLFLDHYTDAVVPILREEGYEPDRLRTFAFDLTEGTLEGLDSGYIDLVQDQQPYLQGYLPLVQACLSAEYGFSGLHILTGSSYIDQAAAEELRPLVLQGLR